MNDTLTHIKTHIYDPCALEISDFKLEPESAAYGACQFKLNGKHIVCRNAKVTPKKVGQFVTYWKRNNKGPIQPFDETDAVDFYAVNVRTETKFGQFVFPKSVLIQKGIITTTKKEGKRAFRVYPYWDTAKSKQAERTQKWQSPYFYEINASTDFKKVSALFNTEL